MSTSSHRCVSVDRYSAKYFISLMSKSRGQQKSFFTMKKYTHISKLFRIKKWWSDSQSLNNFSQFYLNPRPIQIIFKSIFKSITSFTESSFRFCLRPCNFTIFSNLYQSYYKQEIYSQFLASSHTWITIIGLTHKQRKGISLTYTHTYKEHNKHINRKIRSV